MSEAVRFVLIGAVGAGAVAFGGQIAAGFRTLNEAIYRRLPRVIGHPLLRASPVIHHLMKYMIVIWGMGCVGLGLGGVIYVLASS